MDAIIKIIKSPWLILTKSIGKVWIFVAIPFRAYARSVVYNYVLQNGKPLKRLYERSPAFDGNGWTLKDVHYLSKFSPGLSGYIKKRKVNKLQFYLVVFLIWGWLDDDANQDTCDSGYTKELITGYRWRGGKQTDEKLRRWHSIFKPFLKKIDFSDVVYGNAFDLGDRRARYPFFNWLATFVWNDRNTAMNFEYLYLDY